MSGKNKKALPAAKPRLPSVRKMLMSLRGYCASAAYIERVLGLEFGTVEKWEAGKRLTASELALLRLICVYPWMLDVADNRFDAGVANAYVVAAAGAEMLAAAKEKARK